MKGRVFLILICLFLVAACTGGDPILIAVPAEIPAAMEAPDSATTEGR